MAYNHLEIEKKWQEQWAKSDCFQAVDFSKKPKYFALDMFPYPSGFGLHVGHLASYTPTDVVARFKRTKGFNVLHPFGYDAFGLPAEQYAIQTGVHPEKTTNEAIANFRRQLQSFGYSFDWSRELSTCDPSFYKGTQEIFLKLFEKGLAYQKEVPVNWCPALKTVLANEEVVDGKSERGGHPVIRKPMKQWMLKITAYADELLSGLDTIDWREATKEGQRNWIGKSEGATVTFKLKELSEGIEVFTTRPDTLFGATFMVLAPEHPLISKITSKEQASLIKNYIDETSSKSEVDRKIGSEKTGCFTGAYAINPLNDEHIPIWIADYVMMDYGSGAIMAVPAHDERDFEFATQFKIPIRRVLESETELPFTGDGAHINSGFLNGLNKSEGIRSAIEFLEKSGLGTKKVQYKLRDWLFSRQRYWGEPFPIFEDESGQLHAIPQAELPVELPAVADYEPTEEGDPPLAKIPEFLNYTSKTTGKKGKRNCDTMPGSAGSSWYFLRYTDPNNTTQPFDFEKQKYWMPVDLYVGGTEHTVGHLLYSRFWQQVLFDAGLVSHKEPFQKLAHQGVVMGTDGTRMSKSKGNVINPDDVRQEFGADAARTYICFMGPFEKDKIWDTNGIQGIRRFLERFWRLCFSEDGEMIAHDNDPVPESLNKTYHKTLKKVETDIESLSFNTAISAMMILVNDIYKAKVHPKKMLLGLSQMLMPFAPHISEEIWAALGGAGLVAVSSYPQFDEALTKDDVTVMGVQILGKMRGTIEISINATEEEAIALANELNSVQNALEGKSIVKVIYKPGKILNIIIK